MNVLLKKKKLEPPVHHLVQIRQFHGLTNGLVVLDYLIKRGRERSSSNLEQPVATRKFAEMPKCGKYRMEKQSIYNGKESVIGVRSYLGQVRLLRTKYYNRDRNKHSYGGGQIIEKHSISAAADTKEILIPDTAHSKEESAVETMKDRKRKKETINNSMDSQMGSRKA
ncbi:hypothetical protein SERLA73DRAFT_160939 [Serpula lacrymans var. lacrymans S7.3]|uniref:Uncharacterized protein n=1 Tax=Serpula lacrymans var. lacrymans (strain S7.3) TaxID=936435 RepID=F8Q0U9_SERL3|nr:hypothetical protein SERLA73DRAFT_160939 [Serpula lacrymans var. lacrymans S7.3]